MKTAIKRVATVLSIPEAFVVELYEAGVVELEPEVDFEYTVERVRISWTLREDLGVNLAGIEVALHLLSVIERDRRRLSER